MSLLDYHLCKARYPGSEFLIEGLMSVRLHKAKQRHSSRFHAFLGQGAAVKWKNSSRTKLFSLRSDKNYSKTCLKNFLHSATDRMCSRLH